MPPLARLAGLAATLALLASSACSSEPPPSGPAHVCTSFTASMKSNTLHEVDVLFAIDDSASMGDKQAFLADAIGDLVQRLVAPDCRDQTLPAGRVPRPASGSCADLGENFVDAYPPVANLHVGVVTSSLGGGGAPDTCPTSDAAHLVHRGAVSPHVEPRSGRGGGFLAWLPPDAPDNEYEPPPNVPPHVELGAFLDDVHALVSGVGDRGCGLEAQLESWYRFLVQPDPWERIVLDDTASPPRARLEGVDETILAQRRDFLREGSLVAVIVVTDEEDSWSDPLAWGGRGWVTRTRAFPGSPTGLMPRPTTACAATPNDPACKPCGAPGTDADPSCQAPCGPSSECRGWYTSTEDDLNVRYTNDMRRRYGVDPQFPIRRYVDGLRKRTAPDREGEHPGGGGPYVGEPRCTNPLYARDLPATSKDELCHLGGGIRTPDMVLFAVIGGVPWHLLTDDGVIGSTAPFEQELSDRQWQRILGKDPAAYDATGIDPHMIESVLPRAIPCGPDAADDCDPVHGREWDTTSGKQRLDLQYACTFDLPAPRDCSDPAMAPTCDCGGGARGGWVRSPLCAANPNDEGRPTLQVRAKAYPAIRELRVAKAMGSQGITASVCPRTLDRTREDYGYRPAIRAVVDRLRSTASRSCMPGKRLVRGSDGLVQCAMLVVLPHGAPCDARKGLSEPSAEVRRGFDEERRAELDGRPLPPDTVCQLRQVPASGAACSGSEGRGFCYVDGEAARPCVHAIRFEGPPPGQLYFVCNDGC